MKHKPSIFIRFLEGLAWLGHCIGTVVASILLTLLFFTVLALTSIVMKALGSDLLHLRRKDSYYKRREKQPPAEVDRYTHPY